jgi:O-antigen/teichoic acid export membrane protein
MKNFNNVLFLSISTLISGLINYIYHPIMLKFLDIATFAEFESLVSIFNILWVFVWWISFFLLKEISKNSKDLVKIKSIYIYSNKFLLIYSVIIYLIFVLISPILSNYLKIHDLLPLIITWLIIITSFLGVVITPILQWLEKFKIISYFWVLWSIIKLWFGVLFVLLWYKLYWAIAWFIISWFLILILSYIYIYKLFYNTKTDREIIEVVKKDFKKEKKDILYSVILVFLLSIYMNIDILIAKNLFDNNTAWIYAWISIIAKFIIFIGASIETVYYPQIIKSKEIESHYIRNATWMILILWAGSLWFIYFFWNFLLEILKKWFGEYNGLLTLLIIYCIIYTFISFFTKILVWFKKYSINYILWIWLLIIFFMTKYLTLWNLNNFMYIFIWVWISLTIVMLFMIMRLVREKD